MTSKNELQPNTWLIPIDHVRPGHNVREPQHLDELVASIKAVGVLHPILVRSVKPITAEAEGWEVVAGHRRLAAAKKAKLTHIPARGCPDESAGGIALVAATENLERQALTPMQEAEAVNRMLAATMTVKQIADALGRPESWVARRGRISTLTEKWRKQALKAPSSAWSARTWEILCTLEPAAQDELHAEIHDNEWTLRRMDESDMAKAVSERLHVLAGAPFDVHEGGLNGAAPPCDGCPKRASCNPGLFDESLGAQKGATIPPKDRCLDAACWTEKHKSALRAATAQAAMRAGLEDDETVTLILPKHSSVLDPEDAVKAAGKLAGATMNAYAVTKTTPMKEGSKQPENTVAAVDAETAKPVWVHVTKPKTDSERKTVKRQADAKLTVAQRRREHEHKRLLKVVASFQKQLDKQRKPKDLPSLLRLIVAFGLDGSEKPVEGVPTLKTLSGDPWKRIRENMGDFLVAWRLGTAGAPNKPNIALALWAIDQTTGETRKELEKRIAIELPEPKSWAKDAG